MIKPAPILGIVLISRTVYHVSKTKQPPMKREKWVLSSLSLFGVLARCLHLSRLLQLMNHCRSKTDTNWMLLFACFDRASRANSALLALMYLITENILKLEESENSCRACEKVQCNEILA